MKNTYQHIDITNEKVQRIITSAYKIFSSNDFEKASTNNIVKDANVSRGLLYHYFVDKQDLFDFLVDYTLRLIAEKVKSKIELNQQDILERMRDALIVKIEVFNMYPHLLSFLYKYKEKLIEENVQRRMDELYPGIKEYFYTFNIDDSKLKEGIDKDKMLNVIRWTLKGAFEEYMDVNKAEEDGVKGEGIIKRCDDYITFLRSQFFIESDNSTTKI